MTSPDDKTVIVQQPSEPASERVDVEAAEHERTVVMGASPPPGSVHHALPNGVQLAEFEIIGLIGEGGFGIVYLAWDTQLRRNVALKEYIPSALASRVGGGQVSVKSERHEETFRAGLRSFINEARLLAQFDHHSLVKVYRFWEANGTAYMVMPYYEGLTLRESLRQMPAPPDEAYLRALLKPLLEALEVLHAAQCYHRDIAPDNIMLLKNSGRPLLLDFGAARRVIGDMTQALTVILKPGYAPVEQYAEVPSMKQGPWTDLYALGAVAYFAMMGKTPPPSVGRLMGDSYVPLSTAAAGRYSERFLQAIDHALAVRPEDRPQDIHALAEELGIAIAEPDAARPERSATAFSSQEAGSAGNSGAQSSAATSAVQQTSRSADAAGNAAAHIAPPAADATGRASKRPAIIAAVVVCVVALGLLGGWFAMRPAATSNASSESSARNPSVAPAAPHDASHPAATVATAPTPAAPTQARPPASSSAAAPAESTPPPVAETLAPYAPASEFERIVTLADPSIRVTTTLRSATARIGKDALQFRVTSNRTGYAYVFMVDTDGQYLMLFPNQRDGSNAIAAGKTLSLPRASWPMVAGAPAGPNHFLVLVSPQPRDFADAGLHPDEVFATFPPNAQRDAATRRTAHYSPFAGKPRCAAKATDCSDAFGAAVFTIDVVSPPG
jgi:serine/threonine protein kinase